MWFFSPPSESKFRKAVGGLVVMMMILLLFRAVSYQHFVIPSGSMIPTLQVGDFLMINKSSYGYSRFNLPFYLPLIHGRIFNKNKPQIGDVIVFTNPKNHKMEYIKRCVGTPGDRVQIRQGKLYINGVVCQYEPAETEKIRNPEGMEIEYHCYWETLPNGVRHKIMITEDSKEARTLDSRNNTEEFIVPQEHYFALGDNRNQSQDSRYSDPGFVPYDHFLAKASLVCLSFDVNFNKVTLNPLTWYNLRIYPRWGRFGTKVN